MKQLILITSLISGLLLSTMASAKNVILFLGDGMGISTVTAARIFAGQQQGLKGEEYDLAFDRFDNLALVKTYNTDAQVPDSAGTITAIVTGQKTRMGVLSVTAEVPRGDCVKALNHELPTILQLAESAGYASGIVSTTRITHATPAGTYAHSPDRNWENSSEMTDEHRAFGCKDIAQQLIDMSHGNGIDVILGGGREQFYPDSTNDPEYADKTGARDDGKNLVQDWLNKANNRLYAWNREGFEKFDPNTDNQYMALFEPSHMQFEADRSRDPGGEPSIAEMTRFAIKRLQRNEKGYFLLVEGGRIDHAHHFSNAYRALTDTVAMSDAVAAALELVDLDETLILVTADHSHTMTISGYPPRGNPILGKVPLPDNPLYREPDALPYTTLSYANGPGYQATLPDLTEVDTTAPNYQQLGTVPLSSETHAGEDVAAFATGRNAQAVRGIMEQNELFDVMITALFDEQD
ncbi:MAG: alkaline phosphatase [bacterium]